MKSLPLPALLMGTVALLSVAVFLLLLKKAIGKTDWPLKTRKNLFRTAVVVAAGWMVLTGVLAKTGFFADFSRFPPKPVLFMLLPLPFILWIAFSKKFRQLALVTPPSWLVGFQSFRIFVELLLWQGFVKGLLPVQMTLEGRNWDIISGLLGALVGFVFLRKKGDLGRGIAYNFIGMALLINVLVVALLSMPTPLRYFMNEPSLDKIASFPMIWLPTVLVVLAYGCHILSFRQLWILRKEKADTIVTSHVAGNPSKKVVHP